jgi:hypothetical protein
VTGEFPVYAVGATAALAERYEDFDLVAEGPVRIAAFGSLEELAPSTVYYHVPTYTLQFTARVHRQAVEGREVWLVSDHPGARLGAAITMLLAVGRSGRAVAPLSLGTAGVLARPMRTFHLEA